MSDEYYSTPEQVISYTGVKPKDLGFDTEDEEADEASLITLLETWLIQIKSLIDKDRNRDYTAEGVVPAGIDNIALRMAANQVANAMVMRDSPIIRVDEFTLRQVDKDKVLTEAIEKDLLRFPAKPNFRFMRVRTEEEIEEDEEDEEGS